MNSSLLNSALEKAIKNHGIDVLKSPQLANVLQDYGAFDVHEKISVQKKEIIAALTADKYFDTLLQWKKKRNRHWQEDNAKFVETFSKRHRFDSSFVDNIAEAFIQAIGLIKSPTPQRQLSPKTCSSEKQHLYPDNTNAKNVLKQCQEVRPAARNNGDISHHEKQQSSTKKATKRGQGISLTANKTSPHRSHTTTLSTVASHIFGPRLILTKKDVYILIVSFIYLIFVTVYPFLIDFWGDLWLIWFFVLLVTFLVYYCVVLSICAFRSHSLENFSFRKNVPGTGIPLATCIGWFFILLAPINPCGFGEYAWIVTAVASFLLVTSFILGRFGRLIQVRIFGYLSAFLLVLSFLLAVCFPCGVYGGNL